ncbi:MAG: hypothetical protein JW915_24240 [Chitinispirillaceae bacterium]|nr:hypothetical protein [Chitinispirillaceae bacterium]
MNARIHAIDFDAYKKTIGIRPFVALPQEEIDRLYASLEIDSLDMSEADADKKKLPLSIFTVIHFNYSWFTFKSTNNNEGHLRSLGLIDLIKPGNFNGLFLDETLSYEARRIIGENITMKADYTIRLSGLLYRESTPPVRAQVAILYVVRLHQANAVIAGQNMHDVIYYSSGELQQDRDQFDSWSRIIIGHLTAL